MMNPNEEYQAIRLVLYDLDGTLFDLKVDWPTIKSYLQTHHQEEFNEVLPSNGLVENLTYIRDTYGDMAVAPYLELIRSKELVAIAEKTEPLWLITEDWWRLSQLGITATMFGIISNNFHASVEAILARFNLTASFQYIIGRDDVYNVKPDPEGILKILDEHKSASDRCLFIGDYITDEQSRATCGCSLFICE